MEIANITFRMKFLMLVDTEFTYKVIKLDEYPNTVKFILENPPDNKIKIVGEYRTQKSVDEIVDFFNERSDFYLKKFNKSILFFTKSVNMAKFQQEIDNYLRK